MLALDMGNYDVVPGVDSVQGKKVLPWRLKLALFPVLAMGLMCYLAINTARVSLLQAAGVAGEPANCAPCAFLQCQRSMCSPKEVPYVCTAGAASDGCAATAAAWYAFDSTCDACCDATACAHTTPTAEDVAAITPCAGCDAHQCTTYSHKCPTPDPFVCTDGGGTGGCTSDEWQWPTRLNNICNVCCDLTSCPRWH